MAKSSFQAALIAAVFAISGVTACTAPMAITSGSDTVPSYFDKREKTIAVVVDEDDKPSPLSKTAISQILSEKGYRTAPSPQYYLFITMSRSPADVGAYVPAQEEGKKPAPVISPRQDIRLIGKQVERVAISMHSSKTGQRVWHGEGTSPVADSNQIAMRILEQIP